MMPHKSERNETYMSVPQRMTTTVYARQLSAWLFNFRDRGVVYVSTDYSNPDIKVVGVA